MSLFKPVVVKPNPDDLNFGEELAGRPNIIYACNVVKKLLGGWWWKVVDVWEIIVLASAGGGADGGDAA